MRSVLQHFYTDAAENAFRFYFANPTFVDDLLHKPEDYDGIVFRGGSVSDPTATEVVYREYVMGKNAQKIEIWNAAHKTVTALSQEQDGVQKIAILKAAFGTTSDCSIESRVRSKAREVSTSEKQAWAWVSKAFLYWAVFQGLI